MKIHFTACYNCTIETKMLFLPIYLLHLKGMKIIYIYKYKIRYTYFTIFKNDELRLFDIENL